MGERVVCDYCGKPAEKTTGRVVYPHLPKLAEKIIYRCVPCRAHVGCHPGTDQPLGRLANAELRKAKMAAHEAFDPIWRGKPKGARGEAYGWLSRELGVDRSDCHIGMFDVAMCQRVVAVCSASPLQESSRG